MTGSIIAGGYEDIQNVRKGMMNQVRALVRRRNEGIPYGAPEVKKEKGEKTFDKKYSDARLPELIETMSEQDKFTSEETAYLKKALGLFQKVASVEKGFKNPMEKFAEAEPLWQKFLCHIPGIGEVLTTKLIGAVGYCQTYKHISSLWRNFGLHLVCPQCTRKEEDGYIYAVPVNSDGKCPKCGMSGVAPGNKLGQKNDFNGKFKTLGWLIGDCLIKQKSKIYYGIYVQEKARQMERVFPEGELQKKYGKPYTEKDIALKLKHAHNRAWRKMVKIFLSHYWIVARTLAKMPVTEPYGCQSYAQSKLGHSDIITWRNVLLANGVEPEDLAA